MPSDLHYAAQNGNDRVVKMLLDAGEEPNVRNENGESPLIVASSLGHVTTVQVLLKDKRTMVSQPDYNGFTALHVASKHGHKEICELLLKAGTNVDIRTTDSSTPLICAAEEGQLEVIKLLVNRGADLTTRNKLGLSAQSLAVQKDHAEAAKTLLAVKKKLAASKNGIVPNRTRAPNEPKKVKVTSWRQKAISGVVQRTTIKFEPKLPSSSGDTDCNSPLHLAVQNAQIDRVTDILATETSVDPRNQYQQTPLHVAATNLATTVIDNRDNARIMEEITKLLLGQGASPGAKDRYGNSPLHLATSNGLVRITRALIDHRDTDLEALNHTQETPLSLAVKKGHPVIVHMLLRRGANVRIRDPSGASLAHVAATIGNVHVLDILLKYKQAPSVEDTDKYDATPLHYAAEFGNHEAVQLLLKHNAPLDWVDQDGNSPLHLAADRGFQDVVQLLIDAGANRHAKNKFGLTPADLAQQNDHFEVLDIIRS